MAAGENVVLRRLREHITTEGLTGGDRLPSIRELAERFQLGPHVVRDGLLQAQSLGMIELRPRSGAFVRAAEAPASAETAGVTVPADEINHFHLTEARQLIEQETAPLAAERHLPEDLLPLSRALRRMEECGGDLEALIEADERFHLGIARAAKNPAYLMLLQTLLVPLRPFRRSLAPGPSIRERTRSAHRELYHAIRRRDPEAAREAMRAHLADHTRRLMEEIESIGMARRG